MGLVCSTIKFIRMKHYVGNREREFGSDNEWFERFSKGDRRVMEVVFDKFYRNLVNYAYRKIRMEDKAEEFGSAALQKAWERHDRYESPGHLKDSLYLIVRNACISLYRKREAEDKRLSQPEHLQSAAFEENMAVDTERAWVETLSRVWEEINRQLDKRSADMLRLHFEEGLPDAGIAERYRTTVRNVYKIRSLSLKKLRQVWGKDLFWMIILFLTSELP